jgi:hypothetical protein
VSPPAATNAAPSVTTPEHTVIVGRDGRSPRLSSGQGHLDGATRSQGWQGAESHLGVRYALPAGARPGASGGLYALPGWRVCKNGRQVLVSAYAAQSSQGAMPRPAPQDPMRALRSFVPPDELLAPGTPASYLSARAL